MRDIGPEKFNIELLVECEEMRKREQMFIEAFCSIELGYNQVKAYLSDELRRKLKKQYNNEKHQCDCGGRYLRKHKARHERSKKHNNWLKTI